MITRRGFVRGLNRLTKDLDKLADSARAAVERSAKAIDDALAYIEASNRRIAKLEASRLRKVR